MEVKEVIHVSKLSTPDGAILLPGGIVIDGKLEKEVVLREMEGEEDDILADARKEHGGTGKLLKGGSFRVTEVLSRCTVRIGSKERELNRVSETANAKFFLEEWGNALSSDRQFALVQLRRASLGDNYRFNDVCPECKKQIRNIIVDLSTLEVYPFFRDLTHGMSEEDIKEAHEELSVKRDELLALPNYSVKLPRGGTATYSLMRASMEEAQAAIVTEKQDRQITAMLLLQVLTVDGNPVSEALIKSMKKMDRLFLYNLFDEVSGGIDTMVKVVCDAPRCGHEFERKLDLGKPSFFFPLGAA